MSFSETIQNFDFADWAGRISGAAAFRHSMVPGESARVAPGIRTPGRDEVRRALERAWDGAALETDDLAALLSPTADEFLEDLARAARDITRRRFGRVMQLYAPMYLSNYCHSTCTYCGFSFGNKIKRLTLTVDQAAREADILYEQGIRHILLLTGEDYKQTPLEYLGEVSARLAEKFPSISIEVYPLEADDYRWLRTRGVDGLAVYQETYDPSRYQEVHLGGMKKRMAYRLDCPDRGGQAGLRRIAVGALLGLSDPGADAFFAGLHARYLLKHYWQTQVTISLPRLRPAAGVAGLPVIPDRVYARYLFALRVFLPDAGINLSTREPAAFRDHFAGLCVTHMSAGSRTEPGGYSGRDSTEQFEIEDSRSIAEVRSMLEARDLEPVFVDWSPVMK